MRKIMLLCLLMAGMSVVGQTTYKRSKYKDDDVERVWAIDAHIGGGFYQNAHHTGAEVPKYHFGSTQNIGMLTKFHAEYYLPNTNFSLKAGYEHEEVTFLEGEAAYDINQLMLGGRWYVAPTDWWVQPYVGLDMLCAFDAEHSAFSTSASITTGSMGTKTYEYEGYGKIRLPRFSAGPVVGADFYLFSNIAVQVEYSYRLGFDSHYRATYMEKGSSNTSYNHGQLHRHAVSVGLKINFPFTFTVNDRRSLWDGLFE